MSSGKIAPVKQQAVHGRLQIDQHGLYFFQYFGAGCHRCGGQVCGLAQAVSVVLDLYRLDSACTGLALPGGFYPLEHGLNLFYQ